MGELFPVFILLVLIPLAVSVSAGLCAFAKHRNGLGWLLTFFGIGIVAVGAATFVGIVKAAQKPCATVAYCGLEVYFALFFSPLLFSVVAAISTWAYYFMRAPAHPVTKSLPYAQRLGFCLLLLATASVAALTAHGILMQLRTPDIKQST